MATAFALPVAMFCLEISMLGPANRLCVNTPATALLESAVSTMRSLVLSLMPTLPTWRANPFGKLVIYSLPLDGAGGFRGDVVDDSIDAFDLVDDS